MNGWILLHKKIWENPRFIKSPTALAVWVWLLTHTNEKGVVTCGRKQIAEDTGVNEGSVRWLLKDFTQKRGEDDALLSIKPTNKFSIVTILNWQKYQRKEKSLLANDYPTTSQPLATNKEERIKNKEYIYTHLKITNEELENLKAKFPNKEVKVECDKADDWLANTSKRYKDFVAFMRGWLRRSESKVVSNVFVPPVVKVSVEGLNKFKSLKEKFGL